MSLISLFFFTSSLSLIIFLAIKFIIKYSISPKVNCRLYKRCKKFIMHCCVQTFKFHMWCVHNLVVFCSESYHFQLETWPQIVIQLLVHLKIKELLVKCKLYQKYIKRKQSILLHTILRKRQLQSVSQGQRQSCKINIDIYILGNIF